MLRSLYAGVAGMKNFQTKLDVIGNNIANVNTVGFKKGRTTFQDMMSQTTSGGQAAIGGKGGINPIQVGLGSQLGSIDNIHTQGFRETTNIPLDLAIQGDGMFKVASGTIGGADTQEFYTRAGNFYLDNEGYIVNPDGYYLVGYATNDDGSFTTNPPTETRIEIPDDAVSFSIQTNGVVNYVNDQNQTIVAGQIGLANFPNPAGLEKAGNNLFIDSPNAGGHNFGIPEEDGRGLMVSGALEMSNVDLAQEFTEMIVAQRGFQANTRIISTSDEILQELVNLKR